MKRLLSIIFGLLVLWSAGLCRNGMPAGVSADSARHRPPALSNIELHLRAPVPVKLKNPERQFRRHPLNAATLKTIRRTLLEELHRQGFFLAALDSIRLVPEADTLEARLRIYLHSGPRFRLRAVRLQIPDSLAGVSRAALEEITGRYRGRPFGEAAEKRLFRDLLQVLENNGYPLARIETRGFGVDTVTARAAHVSLNLRVVPGVPVRVSDLQIPAKLQLDADYLRRILRFRSGELYREKRVQRYREILAREDFIESAGEPQIVMTPDSSFYLNIPLKLAPATVLDGVVGYVPPPAARPEEGGYLTGMLDLGLRNLFRTGRRLRLQWKKPDRFSEQFHIAYREPFVLGLPLHAGAEMGRVIRDTTYIEWEYALSGEIPLSEHISGIFRFFSRDVYPDSLASARLRLPRTHSVNSALGIRLDTRDNVYNPGRGINFRMSVDYGAQRNLGPPYLVAQDSLARKVQVTRLRGELGAFVKTRKNQVLALNFHTVLIGHKGQAVRLPDMFWFGGATTIRGYREQQFYADRVGWMNLEYWFLLGPRSRFFGFLDVGRYSRKFPESKSETLVGYGLGIRFPGPLGILQVDFGMARGVPFREGKIHFRLINQL